MRNKVVLIVDDEPTNINIVANILTEYYEIRVATSGKIALNILKNEKVDLILLDVVMPEMSGYEVALELLSNEKTKSIPFIFLTGLKDPKNVKDGFAHGAVDYISKPFSKEELLARVLTHLRLNDLQQSLSQTIGNLNHQMMEVQNSKKEFESIFNYSKDGIAILDTNLVFLSFNKAYLEMTRYSKDELLTKSCLDIIDPKDKIRSQEIFDLVLQNEYIENVEKTCIVKNGQRINVNTSISLLPDKKRFLLVVKDVTSLKSLEEHARLASMGELIGNIAHQWRQPLSIISTAASGTKMAKQYNMLDDDTFIKNMDLIVSQSNYLSHTIDDFRSFLLADKEFKNVNIDTVINESISIIESSLKNNFIELVTTFRKNVPIYCCKGEVIQALINIVNNAKDSIVSNVHEESNRYLFISTTQIQEDKILLEILDSGGGIDEKVKSRIFEPYFTTKHQSVGTGIGLTMTYKILHENHNFSVKVYNKEFTFENKQLKGACFHIEIPVA